MCNMRNLLTHAVLLQTLAKLGGVLLEQSYPRAPASRLLGLLQEPLQCAPPLGLGKHCAVAPTRKLHMALLLQARSARTQEGERVLVQGRFSCQ